MEARHHGKNNGGVESHKAEVDHPGRIGELMKEDCGDGGNLGDGVDFAKDAGLELSSADGGIENCGDNQDPDISTEDQDGDASRHEAFVHKHEEEGAEEEFVGNRVEVLSEDGALFEEARQGAIEGVGEAGYDEEDKAEQKTIFQDGGDQERGQADTQQREQVGSGAESVKSFI